MTICKTMLKCAAVTNILSWQ